MTPISAMLPDELDGALEGKPAYRGRQIFDWIHHRLVFDFAEMSNLPASLRRDLAGRFRPVSLEEQARLRDADGTVKFRFRLVDDNTVESVILQDRRHRRSACLSTQVGCAVGCRFCRTGSLGLRRDLNAHEIVDQFLLLRSFVLQQGQRSEGNPPRTGDLSSVVFMGMGEPLANLDNLQQAIEVLDYGGFSPRRITVSTCGLVQGIRSLQNRALGVRLAVSLISADEEVRSLLMPVARSNPLCELRRALLDYQAALGKRITLEIVLMDGINDRPEDVEALVRFVQGRSGQAPLKVLVNLIPWNQVPDFPYQRPAAGRVEWFRQRIEQARILVTTRISRGSSVCGACGQLGLTTPSE